MTIGEYIKTRRTECGWTLRDLSERSKGTSIGYLSDIERGETDPSLGKLQEIAQAFDMGAGDLLVAAGYTVGDKGLPRKTLTITVDITGYVTHREERIDTHHD